jgi:hypothetical protein
MASDCDDTLFCNGAETCTEGRCGPGTGPCPEGETCNDDLDRCEECQEDGHCDDGVYCNGAETCALGRCADGAAVVCSHDEYCHLRLDLCWPVNPYERILFRGFTHDLMTDGHYAQSCDECHHANPSAGFQACTRCHAREETVYSETYGTMVTKLKEALHATEVNGNKGCRHCHNRQTEDELWDCTQCHGHF